MYSGAMRFKHLASSYYLKAPHTASAVRMHVSEGKKDALFLCVCNLVAVCGMCTLCLDLFCRAVKNIRVYLHVECLCAGFYSITLCSVHLMKLSPAINELGFAIAETVFIPLLNTIQRFRAVITHSFVRIIYGFLFLYRLHLSCISKP